MGDKPTISVVMPALNEAKHIRDAVAETRSALGDRFSAFEMLLFNDGSTDTTGAIMDELANEHDYVRVTHHETPQNLGGCFREGVEIAKYEFILMVPGDNENPASALQAPFDMLGQADIVVPYPTNSAETRGMKRHVISRGYVTLLNAMFGLDLRYYNGTVIHRVSTLRGISQKTSSFAYQSEILIKALRDKRTYVEVGIEIEPAEDRETRAFSAGNIYGVLKTLVDLFIEIRVRPS